MEKFELNKQLVSVNILSFNRKTELRNTLNKIQEQYYTNIEIIVVDNSSNDGSPEMVRNEFPLVKLIKLKKNIGIAGWNEGFKIAKGEFILVLDDDSYPEKETISKGVEFMNDSVNCGVLAFEVINLNKNICETKDFDAINPVMY